MLPWTLDRHRGTGQGTSHPTRPGILIRRGQRVVAVLDTKWKHRAKGVAHADIYQIIAYARLYASNRLILLYPAAPDGNAYEVSTRGIAPDHDRLDIASISLERRSEEIQESLRRLVVGDGSDLLKF